jgi:DNA-binding IclR family transcriptional regulator
MAEPTRLRLVERTIDVLDALADGPQSFTAVCRQVSLSKATVHRILTGLSYSNFVVQDPVSGEYLLGSGCYRLLNALAAGSASIATFARPVVQALRDSSGETAMLHVRVGDQRVCVDERASPHALRYSAGVGSSAPLHVGSAGKVLIAWLPEEHLRRLLPPALDPLTPETITDWNELQRTLKQVRQRGWAQSRGERIPGAAAISAPVFDGGSDVVAAVSLFGPESRLTQRRLRDLRDPLVAAAREIGKRLSNASAPAKESIPE